MAQLLDSDDEHSMKHDIDYEEPPQEILHDLSDLKGNVSESDNESSDNETYTDRLVGIGLDQRQITILIVGARITECYASSTRISDWIASWVLKRSFQHFDT